MTGEPTGSSSASGPESESGRAGLYDFIYLDRPRIASYHAQLTNVGALTQYTVTEGTTSARKRSGTFGIPRMASGEVAGTRETEESAQSQYDPTLLAAIDAMETLSDEGSIFEDLSATPLGSLVISKGSLTMLDVRLIKTMWSSFAALMSGQKGDIRPIATGSRNKRRAAAALSDSATPNSGIDFNVIAEIATSMPHPIQATLITRERESIWTTLDTDHFIGSPESLILKHGSAISGSWSMFAILDTRPDERDFEEPFQPEVEGGISSVIRGFQELIRQQFGRPVDAFGATPLAIYRAVPRGG